MRDRNGPATRQEILNAVRHHPGLTKSQLCRVLALSWGTISHHVKRLEEEGLLARIRVRHRLRCFLRPVGPLAQNPLAYEPLLVPILQTVADTPGIGIRDLVTSVEASRHTIRRHLDLLIASGLVAQTRAYRPQFFVIEQSRARQLLQQLTPQDQR